MRPSEALAANRDKVLEIIAKYPVANPRVFGSVARGEDVEGSDIDILVELTGDVSLFDLAKLEIELEAFLGVEIGIHTAGEFRSTAKTRISAEQRLL